MLVYQAVFSGVFILQKDAPELLRPFFKTTFMKHATDGLEMSIMGFNRSRFDCHEMYCHFQDPEKFLRFIEFDGGDFNEIVIVLILYVIVLRFIVTVLMNYQLGAK